MSVEAMAGGVAGISAGEQSAARRVQHVQTMIEAARQVASGNMTPAAASSPATQPANAGFASVLRAATSTGASGMAGPAGASYGSTSEMVGASGVAGYPALADQPGLAAGASAGPAQYESLIDQAAARNGLDPAVLHGLIQQESGFDPNATSSAGASGLTQLMPGTATSLGVANPLDPGESIEGGARYLGQLMAEFGGNTEDALAAYNAGPGAVKQYGGIPPYAETQSYVSKVLSNAETYRQSQPAAAAGVAA